MGWMALVCRWMIVVMLIAHRKVIHSLILLLFMRQLSLRCEYLASYYYSKLIIMCFNMNVGEHLNSGKYLLPFLCYTICACFVMIM